MEKSKSIIYVINCTKRNLTEKIYEALDDLPEIPNNLINICTRYKRVKTTKLSDEDLQSIKKDILNELNKNINNILQNGYVDSVIVYFIVDSSNYKEKMILKNFDLIKSMCDNLHITFIKGNLKKFDFSKLLIYNKLYIEEANKIMKSINDKPIIDLNKINDRDKNTINNDLIKVLNFNAYEQYILSLAEYYNLEKKYKLYKNNKIRNKMLKKEEVIKNLKDKFYDFNIEKINYMNCKKYLISNNNKVYIIDKNQINLIVEDKKKNTNIINIDKDIYYINDKDILVMQNETEKMLISLNVKSIEINRKNQILIYKISNYNQNKIEIYLYDTINRKINFIKTLLK